MFESTNEPECKSRVSTGFETLDGLWSRTQSNSATAADMLRAATTPWTREERSSQAFLPYLTITNEINSGLHGGIGERTGRWDGPSTPERAQRRSDSDEFINRSLGLNEAIGKVQAELAKNPGDQRLKNRLRDLTADSQSIKLDHVRTLTDNSDKERDQKVHRACLRISSGNDNDIKAGERELVQVVKDYPHLAIDARFHETVIRSFADMSAARRARGLGEWCSDLKISDVLPQKTSSVEITKSVDELSQTATDAFFSGGIVSASPRFSEAIETADGIYDQAERNRILLFIESLKQDAKIVQDGLQSRSIDVAVKNRIELNARQSDLMELSQEARLQSASVKSNFAFAKIASGDETKFVEGKRDLIEILSREPALSFIDQFEETCRKAFQAHYLKRAESRNNSLNETPEQMKNDDQSTDGGALLRPKFPDKFDMPTLYKREVTQDTSVKGYASDRLTEAGLTAAVIGLGLYGLVKLRNRNSSADRSSESAAKESTATGTPERPVRAPMASESGEFEHANAVDRKILNLCQQAFWDAGGRRNELMNEAQQLLLADAKVRAERLGLPQKLITDDFMWLHLSSPMDGTKAQLRLDTIQVEVFGLASKSPTTSVEHELTHVARILKRTALRLADQKAYDALVLESASHYFGRDVNLPKLSKTGEALVREYAVRYVEANPILLTNDGAVLDKRLFAEFRIKAFRSLPADELKNAVEHFRRSICHYSAARKSVIQQDVLLNNSALRDHVEKETARLEALKEDYGGSLRNHPEMRKALKGISGDTVGFFDGPYYAAGSMEEIAARRAQKAAQLRDYLRTGDISQAAKGGLVSRLLDSASRMFQGERAPNVDSKKVNELIERIRLENKLERLNDDLKRSRNASSASEREAHFENARKSAKQILDGMRPDPVDTRCAENCRLRLVVDYFLIQDLISTKDIPFDLRRNGEHPPVIRSRSDGVLYRQNEGGAASGRTPDTADSARSSAAPSSERPSSISDMPAKPLTDSQRAGLKHLTELALRFRPTTQEQIDKMIELAHDNLRRRGCSKEGLNEFAALCKDFETGKPDAVKAVAEALGNRGTADGRAIAGSKTDDSYKVGNSEEQVTRAELQQKAQKADPRARAATEAMTESELASRLKSAGIPEERSRRIAKDLGSNKPDLQSAARKEVMDHLRVRNKSGFFGEAKGRAGAIAALAAFGLDCLK